MKASITRPDNSEFSGYAETYINAADAAVSELQLHDVRELLAQQCDQLDALLAGINEEQANRAYAPGKWTLKESLVHVSDAERVFSYRAMRFARADKTALPGFEQDDYVPESRANARSLANILSELRAVRGATLALVDSLDEAAIEKVGTASGKSFSTRALCWMMAGHCAHHIGITRDRYLPAIR